MRPPWAQHSAFLLTFFVLLAMAWQCLQLPDRPFLGLNIWRTEVTAVRPGSPAHTAGLRAGDDLESFSDTAPAAGIDARALPSPLSFLKTRGTRPTRLFLRRQEHRLWAELVPRPLPTRERAWNLGLAAGAAMLLLLGVFTFVHRSGLRNAAFVGLCLLLSFLLSPFAQDASTGGLRNMWMSFPGDRTGLLAFVSVAMILAAGMLWYREDRTTGADLERLAQRWLVYLGFASLTVVLYFVGFLCLDQLATVGPKTENQLVVGLALVFFGWILSPVSERMISSLNRYSA